MVRQEDGVNQHRGRATDIATQGETQHGVCLRGPSLLGHLNISCGRGGGLHDELGPEGLVVEEGQEAAVILGCRAGHNAVVEAQGVIGVDVEPSQALGDGHQVTGGGLTLEVATRGGLGAGAASGNLELRATRFARAFASVTVGRIVRYIAIGCESVGITGEVAVLDGICYNGI